MTECDILFFEGIRNGEKVKNLEPWNRNFVHLEFEWEAFGLFQMRSHSGIARRRGRKRLAGLWRRQRLVFLSAGVRQYVCGTALMNEGVLRLFVRYWSALFDLLQ